VVGDHTARQDPPGRYPRRRCALSASATDQGMGCTSMHPTNLLLSAPLPGRCAQVIIGTQLAGQRHITITGLQVCPHHRMMACMVAAIHRLRAAGSQRIQKRAVTIEGREWRHAAIRCVAAARWSQLCVSTVQTAMPMCRVAE
jgi:hypothetical protein